MNIKKALTFKDVLLTPQFSKISSRSEVNTQVKINNYTFNHPMIVANMKDLVGSLMLLEVAKSKGLIYMHRFNSFEEQMEELTIAKNSAKDFNINLYDYVGVSIGIKEEDKKNLKSFYDDGVRHVCIDIAHGDSQMCIDMIKYIKQTYNDVLLCAGNVCTYNGAYRLWNAGADIVKVGIGNGSICSTRIRTGNGIPQLHAVMEVARAKENYKNYFGRELYFISDGGCSTSGDVSKALCFADMVMAGNIFAGSWSCPGEVIECKDHSYMVYRGSSTLKDTNIEGYVGKVKVKPHYSIILEDIMQGVRSCCSYQGVDNLIDLKESPEFVEITNSGIVESGAHGIIID